MRFLALLLAPLLLVGCASLHPEKMVPDKTSYGAHHDRTVALNVGGGNAAIGWYSGTITREQFEEAIRRSIEGATLFRQIASGASADYILSADLKYAASHPGFNMTAWVNVNWSLVDRATGRNIWAHEVNAEGAASTGEALNGRARQYMALERAGKANIERALSQVGALQLKAP